MVSKKKSRIQVTMDKDTVELLDKLVEKLNNDMPMAKHTRSSILEGASLLRNLRRVVLPALSKPRTNILASLSDFFNFLKRSSNPIVYIIIYI